MNIGIVLGVSEYIETKNNLPGCKNDAFAINEILNKTGKFAPVLYLNGSESSAKTKELLTDFISEHKGKEIDELFFYFSGHGEFNNEEFYYLLSDHEKSKRNQTSLQNKEMDDLFRTLSPKLLIKVIDACQSGTMYIKGDNDLSKYFNESKKSFTNCYFFNSSLNTQSSYQTPSISKFTLSFINSLKEHKTNEIRYKDIIDFISDEFQEDKAQTPLFIVQADYTEKFTTISEPLKDYLKEFNKSKIAHNGQTAQSLTDLVKQDAKNYIDEKGMFEMMSFVKEEFKKFKINPDLNELYQSYVSFVNDYLTVPNNLQKVIGESLSLNKNDYFAKPIKTKVPVFKMDDRRYLNSPNSITDLFDSPTEYVWKISGFDLTIELPFKLINIDIISQYPNINNYNSQIIILTSKKFLTFHYFITNYLSEGWSSTKINSIDLKLYNQEVKITNKEHVKGTIETIFMQVNARIKDDLSKRYQKENIEEVKKIEQEKEKAKTESL